MSDISDHLATWNAEGTGHTPLPADHWSARSTDMVPS
jgi:hypothetical protein